MRGRWAFTSLLDHEVIPGYDSSRMYPMEQARRQCSLVFKLDPVRFATEEGR